MINGEYLFIRRGIGHCTSGALCEHAIEDLTYALQDCPFVKDVWMLSATEVIKNSSCWARQYKTRMSTNKRNNQRLTSANIPDNSWVFPSTDGAVARDSRCTAIGGVARDHEGNWIVGFSLFLGVCSSFEAEAWGILDGVLILLNKGYRKISILTDNFEVVQVLSVLDLEDSRITVFRRAQRIMRAEGKWKIKHIPRNRNLVANHLAKLA
ncbi:hypothetical protein J1N35_032705 [Gossypium stocksii]|uniref:RNase H type-1 domain-containing protein n=1 Tax=Gossypium stocksii TaxID=47602 RepID=A0A9D3ZVY7_9ROSI|nr:hypothetical protein J1N35_032705 [Gossypium stocksii]